jgi:DNA polymerase-1
MKKNKLFLLDVYPILYRSHFAMMGQHLVSTKGLNTSAILGFCNYLFQILFKEKPSHIVAAFDNSSTHRLEMLNTYKASRDHIPDDIIVARDYVTSIIDALNFKSIKIKGAEADDIIGTVAVKAAQAKFEVYIVSPDKDFAQLANDSIFLYRPSYKGLNFEVLNGNQIEGKYGVPPERIPDLLALKGDPSDNIPGVPKIGEKTAIDLLQTYSSLEEILLRKEEIQKKSIRETLIQNQDLAKLSKQLALINTQLPIEFNEEEFRIKAPNTDKLVSLLDELEFVRLKERIFSNSFYKKAFNHKEPKNHIEDEDESVLSATNYLISEEGIESLFERIRQEGKMMFLFSNQPNLEFYIYQDNQVHVLALNENKIPASFISLMADDQVEKITYDIKPILKFLLNNRLVLKGKIYDLMLEHYTLSPEANHQLDKIISQETGQAIRVHTDKERMIMEVSKLSHLHDLLWLKLGESQQMDLYNQIDLPLSSVLARVELNGIRIDKNALADISQLFQKEMEGIQNKIYDIAGHPFNINSSKQVSEVLTSIVKDPSMKKTKTGQLSTSEATLMEFAAQYEIAELLLRYRRLNKIVTTYTDSLPKFINSKTERIHADFQQVTTSTGRLSCLNPNLQNLPIRTEEGREIRKAIIPHDPDSMILAADYSQIELRLFAGLSKDETLCQAFADQLDVHTITASKVFNVNESEVTEEMRSKSKMVNYGIAYGISPFGLSQRLKISMAEAKEIIKQYFEKFPGIKTYIENSLKSARELGYTCTITNRRRYIDDINSRNGTERRAAERMAINAPIQGLAADLIKLSMIEIDSYLKSSNMKSKMIMQVHDELVFEAPKSELIELGKMVREKMEHAIDFPVPLEVNIGVGKNWLDLEDFNC